MTPDRSPLLAVIPARGGSRRVPRKNIRPLLGRPAIVYTIEAALQSALFEQVVVSTDDEEIAGIARGAGGSVPFLRAPELADDGTHVSAVTADALLRLDPERRYRAVAQLMPNCPLRTADDIRASFAAFEQSDAPAQLSMTPYGMQNPWWATELSAGGVMQPVFPDRMTQRSQDLPELYCPTGAIWWARADVLRAEKTFHVAGRTGWVIPWERAADIDTEDDWRLVEQLMHATVAARGADAF
jgi:N-acylneuraminate cytidylyltransferase